MTTMIDQENSILGLVELDQVRRLLADNIQEEDHWIKTLSDGEFRQVFKDITHTKRFLQQWDGNPEFREAFKQDPQAILKQYNLQIDPEEIRSLWDRENFPDKPSDMEMTLLVKRSLDFAFASEENPNSKLVEQSHNQQYKAWRQRQIARCGSQVVKAIHDQIGHFPVSFELSKGCSVGCWFCSVSAPRLNDIFFYTPENAQLWQEVLEVLKELLGTASADGFCYWATDPLDNPDYEKFLCDFHSILGVFPQTTTAQPLKDVNRTKYLLKLSLEKGCKMNRFSILSLKMLNRLHELFTPEELAFVGLVIQNQEAEIVKANSGRMRQYNQRQAEKKNEVLDDSLPSTNACVTGFLFNMVDRTVKLISPCPADERWENGYRIYAEAQFKDAQELKSILTQMIDTHMSLTLKPDDKPRFRRDLNYQELDNGFQLSNRLITIKFTNDPYLKQLGKIILKGEKTVKEIVGVFSIFGIPANTILKSLNLMFDKGVLDDEPA